VELAGVAPAGDRPIAGPGSPHAARCASRGGSAGLRARGHGRGHRPPTGRRFPGD